MDPTRSTVRPHRRRFVAWGAALALAVLAGCSQLPAGADAPTLAFDKAGGTAPLDGAVLQDTVTIVVEDRPNYQSVSFYLDDPQRGDPALLTLSAPPYQLVLHTQGMPNGSHTLTAVATIGRGGRQTKVAASATFTVDNATTTANAAPVVDAGPDLAAVTGTPAALDGSATDDGLPSASLGTAWSKVSGPGAVSFVDSSAASTSATFAVAGSYLLRLTADDGALQASDEVAVTVTDPATGGNPNIAVQAFYYPWYGNPTNDQGTPGTNADGWRHWQQNNHTPPDDLGTNYYPTLGPYSNTNPTTLDQHMQWMHDAGIGVAIISWWGQGSWEDNHLPAILNAAQTHHIKIAFHLEPYPGRTPTTTTNDIAYLETNYGAHPAYLHVSRATTYGTSTAPRGVYYIFDVLASGSLSAWKSAMDSLHSGPHDALVLAQRVSTNPIDDAHFDGVYTYDVLQVDPTSFLTYAPTIDASGGIFAPSVGPGYDETRAITGSTRYANREHGARYDRFWQNAIDSGAPWITITSFNEWHEGTQIEPATPKTTPGYTYSDYTGTYNTTPTNAPMAYLNRTRTWVNVFLGQAPAPPPAVSVTLDPSSASLQTGGSTSFSATVTGASDTSVTWGADGGSVSGSGTTVTYTAPASAGSYHLTATSVADPSASATATIDVSAPPPPGSAVTIAAAGDIACDPASGSFNGGSGTSSSCHMQATADLLLGIGPDAVLTLGDNQYENGALAKYQASYAPSWGQVKGVTRPVPGNHEYGTSQASGYYGYFGSAAGDPAKGYYSYDLGAWHLIALNSNCGEVGGCGAGSPQETWLQADLAAHTNACTLAYWHHPRYSSGQHGDHGSVTALWQALYDAGAELVLSGHDHDYERFAPQDAQGNPDAAGMRQFVVGTGGKNHYAISALSANSEVHNDDTFGVLKLVLRSDGYDWQFLPEPGKTFTDSGTSACH